MRRLIRAGLVAAMVAVASPGLAAPGINLAWSSCHGEATSTGNRSFACDTNAGTNVLVVSFVLPQDVLQVSGNEMILDLISQSATLPLWWDMKNTGTCRITSLAVNTTFDFNNVVCMDWAQGLSQAGLGSYNTGTPGSMGSLDPAVSAQHRRLTFALAVPPSGLQDLVADTEYFSSNITIDDQKTVGTGACAGCTEPVCIVLNSMNVTTPLLANNVYLPFPSTPGSNIVTWQGTGANCQAAPVRNTTWAQVKTLYR